MYPLLIFLLFFTCILAVQQSSSCLFCETTADGLLTFLNTSHAEEDVENAIDIFCNILPASPRESCTKIAHNVATFLHTLPKLADKQEYSGFALCSMFDYCAVQCCVSDKPEQVHISFGENPSEMDVVWTMKEKLVTEVWYGKDPSRLDMQVNATSHTYTTGGWDGWIYVGKMLGLEMDTRYYYKVGNQDGYSDIFNFYTERKYEENDPTRIIMYGDMGADEVSDITISRVQKVVEDRGVDFVIHDGDISYADGFQERWDTFMRKIEPVAANTPYMVCPGNHEIGIIGLLGVTLGYPHRFSLPGKNALGPELENMYYSFNYRNVHFISIDTESIEDTALITDQQLEWLENDLKSVDRKSHPWVIVFGHRPLYCSNRGSDCQDGFFATYLRDRLEPLFHKYNVDIVFMAHKHDYERMWPVYQSKPTFNYNNPREPTYILNGAGGNREGFTGIPSPRPDYSAAAMEEWGYGILTIYNNTVLNWTFYISNTNEIGDTFTLYSTHQ